MSHKSQIKLKPWGREIWFAHTDKYAGKILEIKKGHRLSLQYHEKKEETQYVIKGKIKFTYGKFDKKNIKNQKFNLKEKILNCGDKINIPPYTIHRLEALMDSEVFEVSTPDLKDVVKLDDDYGRTGKGNNEKLDNQLYKSQKF